MRIILWARAFYDVMVQLANALAATDQVFLFIQTERWEGIRHDSIFTLKIPDSPGVFSEGDSEFIQCFPAITRDLIDHRVKLFLVNFPSIKIKNLANLLFTATLARLVKMIRPDVMNVHGVNFHFLFTYPLLAQIPVVFTVHDYLPHSGEEGWQCRVFNSLIARIGYDIIVYGRFQQRKFIEQYKQAARKVKVIPMGVLDVYRHWFRGDVNEEDNSVLFFGRISPYKGIEYLIRAASRVRDEHPHVKVIIAGKGDMSTYGSLMKDPTMYMIYNQYIPNELAAKLFQQASVVVLPYTDATQSAVLMTAFAFEKPVVVTGVGGIAETVEDGVTGFIVPPCDEEGLARAISALLKDPEMRMNMKRNIGDRARGVFSWKQIAAATDEAYRTAVNRRGE